MITYPQLGKNGRLGNQMFQIASTLGLAETFRMDASFPDWTYQPYFNIPKQFFSNKPGLPSSVLARQLPKRHQNYLQDFHLFENIKPKVLEYFKPSAMLNEIIHNKYADFLKVPDKTAVHIRRTDYTYMNQSYQNLSAEYYNSAMKDLKTQFPKTEFFIFSDDIEWCRANLSEKAHYVSEIFSFEIGPSGFPEGNKTDVEDLILMSLCEHHICSNSTYSWWSAYLSHNSNPIVPAQWFGPELSDMKMENYLLPSWTARAVG